MTCWGRINRAGQAVVGGGRKLIEVSSDDVERIKRTLTATILANLGDHSLSARLVLSFEAEHDERQTAGVTTEAAHTEHTHESFALPTGAQLPPVTARRPRGARRIE
ncbi:MAG: hypothetical protein QOK43_1975 [Acidimicrobiaceae bacterium]|nr:hypothetical protein [Acidimicrobiaceae bacterium]